MEKNAKKNNFYYKSRDLIDEKEFEEQDQ